MEVRRRVPFPSVHKWEQKLPRVTVVWSEAERLELRLRAQTNAPRVCARLPDRGSSRGGQLAAEDPRRE